MNIPYYRIIDNECYLINSEERISELSLKLLAKTISDREYDEFIRYCLLKTKFK